MDPTTGFFHVERCLWHSTQGLFSLVLPVGNWVQPPASAGLAESPESKRRAVSLMQVSGLAEEIKILSADEATTEDLLRVHPTSYLKEFEKLSAAGVVSLELPRRLDQIVSILQNSPLVLQSRPWSL